MDVSLNRQYEALTETVYIDLKNAKPLSEGQAARFKDYFSIESENLGLFYNDLNLIIADAQTFAEMETFIKSSKITTRVECKDHNLFLVVYPYFNDTLIRQALEDPIED